MADLFPNAPRRPRRTLLYVADASDCHGNMVHLRCRKCDYDHGWRDEYTVTEVKRGIPCPRCNGSLSSTSETDHG